MSPASPASSAPTDALTTPEPTPVANATIVSQMAHRTVRAYTDEPLAPETLETLLEVARHGATSSFQQQATIIRVVDPAVREQVHLASGQPYVGGARGELFVLVVDLHRNAVIRERAGAPVEPLERTSLFLQGVQDTMIAAQNLVVAAESLGLGTTYLGSILGDAPRVIRALGLPTRTFPLVGLLVGHAAQEPQYKPRLPRELTCAVDAYPDLEAHRDALADYDARVAQYYDLRDTSRRVDAFTTQIARALGGGAASQAPVLDVLRSQLLCLR
ncbi:MAG: nitroreductase family protein [Actinomyces sp.]|uniref:nitroreductase family protein n=1 Tax=Actinomyces sp. TaxID=29317 RepID=UPI0026DD227D|nr:nitroreductase family protein [Actinomyces sp.]MDO4243969.1 nitroreductase family protein [Actinomyces sp.]